MLVRVVDLKLLNGRRIRLAEKSARGRDAIFELVAAIDGDRRLARRTRQENPMQQSEYRTSSHRQAGPPQRQRLDTDRASHREPAPDATTDDKPDGSCLPQPLPLLTTTNGCDPILKAIHVWISRFRLPNLCPMVPRPAGRG
jgi:hypothetical protein